MANIQLSELNTVALNRLEADELNLVVGGNLAWGNFFGYSSTRIDISEIRKSFIGQTSNNNSVILQGTAVANVAEVLQGASNAVL